jgi:hypothetical protein
VSRIVLHIGSTKTGTSSLQTYFSKHASDLRSRGVIYPRAGRNAPGQMAHHNLCYQKQSGRVANGIFKPEVGTWSQALAEIDGAPGSAGIISSEAFMNCQPQQVGAFARELSGREVQLVAYVRRQDKWLQSAWNQLARFGRCSLDFQEFYLGIRLRGRGDYFRMLNPWVEAFGTSTLAVRNFDALSAEGIVPDFFEAFFPGVPVQAARNNEPRTNTMAGVKQLVAVSIVLGTCREQIAPEFQLPSTSAIRIADYFRHRDGEMTKFSILSYEQACEIQRDYTLSNRQLEASAPDFRESGGFPSPQPEEFANHIEIAGLGLELFDSDERRFLIRMAREIRRSHNKPRYGRGTAVK